MGSITTISNIATLRALSTPLTTDTMFVQGYYNPTDGGEGLFFNSGITGVGDNGGTIIVDAVHRVWLRETSGAPYNVAWFGAVHNGSSDDTAAIQNAINAVQTLGGGVVFFPARAYLIAPVSPLTPVVVNAPALNLVGEGKATIIVNGTPDSAAITIEGGVFNCGCFSMIFAQQNDVVASAGNCGLMVNDCHQGVFRDIGTTGLDDTGYGALYDGLYFSIADQCVFSGLQVENCANNGISLISCADAYIDGSRSDENTNDGWYIQSSQGLYVANCTAYGNAEAAWSLDSSSVEPNPNNFNCFFVDCIGDTSGSYNWQIKSLSKGFFANCWGSTQKSTDSNTFANGFILSGPPSSQTTVGVDDIMFLGGGAFQNNSHGVVLLHTDSGSPANVQFVGFTFGETYNDNGNGKGEHVASAYGLFVDDLCDKIRVIGGSGLGNLTGPILISSSATDIVVDGFVTGTTAPSGISVTGPSPFMYQNSDGANEQVTVAGGSVSQIEITRGTDSIDTNLTSGVFQLRPNDILTVTFSSAPTMTRIPT